MGEGEDELALGREWWCCCRPEAWEDTWRSWEEEEAGEWSQGREWSMEEGEVVAASKSHME